MIAAQKATPAGQMLNVHELILHLAATTNTIEWEDAYLDARRVGRELSLLPPHYYCYYCRPAWPCPAHVAGRVFSSLYSTER